MLPLLLPLVTAVVPEMAKWLFPSNPKAGAAVAAVTDVVQSVTGGDATTAAGVAAIQATLAGKPEMAIELQQKLAELHASMQAEADQAQQAALVARLADVANARSQTVALAQAHSPIAWAAPVVSVVVTVGFFVILFLLITGRAGQMDPGVKDILNISVGTLGGAFVTVVSFWVGSSQGSRDKSATIARMGDQLAASTPPPA